MVGVLDEWNHERGYGFITNDRRDVRLYLHVTELVGGMIPPCPVTGSPFSSIPTNRGVPRR